MLLTLGMRMPGGGDTRYEPKLFERVPADAVAALSFGGTQGILDRVQGNVDLDKVSGTIEELTGVSLKGLTDALSGEGALYVRPGAGKVPEVTLVLRPPDAAKTWDTLDRLGRKLAEQAKATVTVRTEGGIEVRRVTTDQVTVSYARAADDTIIATTGADGIQDVPRGRARSSSTATRTSGPRRPSTWGRRRAASSTSTSTASCRWPSRWVRRCRPTRTTRSPPSTRSSSQATGAGDVTKVSGFVRLNG